MSTSIESVRITKTLEATIDVHVSLEKAFAAFTTPDGLSSWWTNEAALDLDSRTVKMTWQMEQGQIIGESLITKWEAPHTFEIQWAKVMNEPVELEGVNVRGALGPIRQSFHFEALASRITRVHVIDRGFSSQPDHAYMIDGCRKSWLKELANLKSVLETGIDLRTTGKPAPKTLQ